MFYLETLSHDPAYNLAFEEYVLRTRTEGDWLILWQNENTVVVGLNQNTLEEIDPDYVQAQNIRVVRRSTGGGAVYHDLGNLNFSFITDAGDLETLTMERFTTPVANALRGLGLDAEASGRNDILVSGKKVSGSAQRLLGSRLLHHGTLLFDSDGEVIRSALRPDPEKFTSKSSKSVQSRVGNIRSFLKNDMTMPEFIDYLKSALAEHLTPAALTEDELEEVRTLATEKYGTWEWNYGRSPAFDFHARRRWPGGTLEVFANVENGRITDIDFRGDFLSVTPPQPLREALHGKKFTPESLTAALTDIPLHLYLGTITQEQLLSTIFTSNATSAPAT